MNETCSILVNSCDKYHDAWHPFFTLLKKYWSQCEYKLYLNTESKSYTDYGVITLNSDSPSWTGRLIDSLQRIESEFILFMLEDFFLMGQVDDLEIKAVVEKMKNDDSIAVVYPKRISTYSYRDDVHPEWIRMDVDKNQKYMVNCQFAIWNKKLLLDILNPGLSPWQLEREFKLPENCKYKFYCFPNGSKFSIEGDVFPYLFAIQKGYGIAQSKWLWNNKKFFKNEGVEVNYDSLGVLSYPEYLLNKLKYKLNIKH